jgi:hypothetical protein
LFGYEVWTAAELTSQGYWWSNDAPNQVKMYSVGNPASVYSSIEVTFNENGIAIGLSSGSVHDIIVENIHMSKCGWSGMMIDHSNNIYADYNITVRDNDVSFCGGAHSDNSTTRMGNGINVYGDAHDITIIRNKTWQIYDAGITLQGFKIDLIQYNIYINYNIIYKVSSGFEFWSKYASDVLHDIYFYNNTIYDIGGEWSHSQRPDVGGTAIMRWNALGIVNNFYIVNNIIDGATNYAIRFSYVNTTGTDVILDHNIYYPADLAFLCENSTCPTGTTLDFAGWKICSGQDSNTTIIDPLFVSTNTPDFHLQAGSLAIKAGTNVSLTSDYEGKTVPMGSAPDIGAYESLGY